MGIQVDVLRVIEAESKWKKGSLLLQIFPFGGADKSRGKEGTWVRMYM